MADTLRRESRQAIRSLARSPVFTIVAVLTLALGIGATTAIFTVLDRVVLRPLPYPNADRLVTVRSSVSGKTTGGFWGVSVAQYFEYRRHNHTFEELGAFAPWRPTIAADGEPERVAGALVTASLVRVLGLRAMIGRVFAPNDDRPGVSPVVLLGHELWQRRYGGDRGLVGKQITVEGQRATVIGVMEPGMQLPDQRVDLWLPLTIDSLAPPVNDHSNRVLGRLKPGVTREAARADLAALTRRFPELFPNAYSPDFMREYHFTADVTTTRDVVLGTISRVLWVLLGSVGLVLLVACANVANLYLVRLELRQREVAVRRALGASQMHLAWHFLSESLLIAIPAGMIGLLLAWSGIRFLLALAPSSIPRLAEVHLDAATVLFAAAISSFIGIVFGLAPSLRHRLIDLGALREGARGSTASRGQLTTRDVLLVGQVALALVLLAAAALLVQSFRNLRSVQPGFDATGALGFTVALPRSRYQDYASVEQFYRQLSERLASVPEVTAVGETQALPLAEYSGAACALVFIEDRPLANGQQAPCIPKPLVSPTYFSAMRIPVRGRVPTWNEVEGEMAGVVISESLARHLWPGEDAIGKGISNSQRPPYYRVVGVAGDVRSQGLDQPVSEAIYYPLIPLRGTRLWSPPNELSVIVRTGSGHPETLASSIRRIVGELDRTAPIANIEPLTAIVTRSMSRVSIATLLLGIAAAMALLLSGIGVFGAIAFVVSRRRREIGVRIALGARPDAVSARIVLQALRLGVIGAAIGVAVALVTTRVLRSLLVGVAPSDPIVLVTVSGVVLAVVAVASYLPARRAAGISPVEALRAE
jgi:putative ABC transport system permease protein